VVRSGATILHYGWAKPPERMDRKMAGFHYWYRGEAQERAADPQYRFRQLFGLRTFSGDHPAVMREIVARQDWQFEPEFKPSDWNRKEWKNMFSRGAELLTGRRWGERKKYKLLPPR
jgi:hypothetical protein